jgi:hypothetical protein
VAVDKQGIDSQPQDKDDAPANYRFLFATGADKDDAPANYRFLFAIRADNVKQ